MTDTAESTLTRLWQDRVQLREQERNEALSQARTAQTRAAALTAENERLAAQHTLFAAQNAQIKNQNDRLAAELARLRQQNDRLMAEVGRLTDQIGQLATEIGLLRTARDTGQAATLTETEQQMETLKTELLSLIDGPLRRKA